MDELEEDRNPQNKLEDEVLLSSRALMNELKEDQNPQNKLKDEVLLSSRALHL